jgi:acetaldehyde dehydrogenase/alcohol dehydrogenase
MEANEQKNTPYLQIKANATQDEKVEALIGAIESLKNELGVPKSIKDWGIDEGEFLAAVDELSMNAFDDQCTSANPRYPLISQIKQLYLNCYYGTKWVEEA